MEIRYGTIYDLYHFNEIFSKLKILNDLKNILYSFL